MHNSSLLRRLGAMLYDSLLVIALLALATLPFIAFYDGEYVTPGDNAYQFVLLFVMYAFFVGFWTHSGRTLGMQAWRIQLEAADGKPPDIVRASLRFVTAIVSLLPLGAGFLWQLIDRDGLAWHDRLSGTRLRYYPKQDSSTDSDS